MLTVLRDHFYHDAGRGPELVRAHYGPTPSRLIAVDYRNPDAEQSAAGLRHLVFARSQVFMFTPEEVENYVSGKIDWGGTGRAAAVCLGRSAWVNSFSPTHLARCEHYRLMFYDEFLDVICEGITSADGGYVVA